MTTKKSAIIIPKKLKENVNFLNFMLKYQSEKKTKIRQFIGCFNQKIYEFDLSCKG